jgi:hypothetical protein
MFGRSGTGLLAITLLVLLPCSLRAQTERDSASDFSIPRLTLPPEQPPHSPPSDPPADPRLSNPDPGGQPPTLPPREPAPPGTYGFSQITRAAGTIFSGTVTAITHLSPSRAEPFESVSITFRVENGIRGASAGETFTIRQWIGLWSSGQRYRVGQRVLLFLYPPSKLGLTSSVGGQLGRFNVDPLGRVLLSAQHLSAFRSDPVLGGRSRVSLGEFTLAVHRAGEEE